MFLSIVRSCPAPENWAERHPSFQRLSEAKERHRKITNIHMLILIFIWRITQPERRFLSVRQQIWAHSKSVGKLSHSSRNTARIPGIKCNEYICSHSRLCTALSSLIPLSRKCHLVILNISVRFAFLVSVLGSSFGFFFFFLWGWGGGEGEFVGVQLVWNAVPSELAFQKSWPKFNSSFRHHYSTSDLVFISFQIPTDFLQ